AILIGVAIDVTLRVLPDLEPLALRGLAVLVGIGLVGLGSGVYLACRLGPGPRDGLMTGLHRRTGLSLRVVRTGIELSAVASGFALGGTVGIGTLAFALAIGPLVQAAVGALSTVPSAEL
ncbi:MAG: YczE/YyaS/YitT family protein, partial [Solirubrobacteraceae bacterium]